ncbi:equilibrative nucleobase transporter 1-like [Heterodontus francisci]|uniref:equilibrative nucleobase transporter 1-like n=1 Tax=Heterodontus francisci TaxID=7792 RepID=UPI00355BB35D
MAYSCSYDPTKKTEMPMTYAHRHTHMSQVSVEDLEKVREREDQVIPIKGDITTNVTKHKGYTQPGEPVGIRDQNQSGEVVELTPDPMPYIIQAEHASSALLYVAFCLITIGGNIHFLTNIQVGNLFGNKRSIVMTLYDGATDSSAGVFLLVKVLYEAGLSLRSMFLFISGLNAVHILRTFFLLPRRHIPYPIPPGYTYGISCAKFGLMSFCFEDETASQRQPHHGGDTTEGEEADRREETEGEKRDAIQAFNNTGGEFKNKEVIFKPLQIKERLLPWHEEGNEEEIPSFRSCIFSKLFLTHLLWFSIIELQHNLFIGTLNPMLTQLTRGNSGQVGTLLNAFAFTQLCAVLCAPWSGLIMDRHKCRTKQANTASESQRLADMKSAVLSQTITITISILFSISATIPVLEVQYLTFVLQVISRSFLSGGCTTFITVTFPLCHFGKIYGLGQAISAIVSLLQYPFFTLIQGPLQDNPLYLNIGFIVLVTLTCIHPINVYLHIRRENLSEQDDQPESNTII